MTRRLTVDQRVTVVRTVIYVLCTVGPLAVLLAAVSN